jgi:hypothetical protein
MLNRCECDNCGDHICDWYHVGFNVTDHCGEPVSLCPDCAEELQSGDVQSQELWPCVPVVADVHEDLDECELEGYTSDRAERQHERRQMGCGG